MLNKYLKKITTLSKLISTTLIIIMLFIAHSKFLILSLTIIEVIMLLELGDIEKKVKEYLNLLKKLIYVFVFIILMYIIIIGFDFNLIILIYKLVLCALLLKCFFMNCSFEKLDGAIYKLFKPLRRLNVNVDFFAYNTTLYIYLMKYFTDSGNKIKKSQKQYGLSKISVKEMIIPRLIAAINKINILENNLKIKFYNRKIEKINSNSVVALTFLSILFITVIIKEVII